MSSISIPPALLQLHAMALMSLASISEVLASLHKLFTKKDKVMLQLPIVVSLALVSWTLLLLMHSPALMHEASRRDLLHAPTTTTTSSNSIVGGAGGDFQPLQTEQVRYLFGIFSSQGETERVRRSLIRSTYLNYYHDNHHHSSTTSSNSTSSSENVVCSLYELQEDYHRLPQHRQWQDCQIVFTFVVAAGGDKAPTERLSETEGPLTLSQHPNMTTEETDITYLNVRENMNEGKSQTWLYYGATWARLLNIDYIVKLDSDAMLFPGCFLDQMTNEFGLTKITIDDQTHNKSHIPATAIYAGFPWDLHCSPAQYPFHSGHFYFLSADLVLDIAREECNRTDLEFSYHRIDTVPGCPSRQKRNLLESASVLDGAEDMSMGNFVTECRRRPVRFVNLGGPEWGKQGSAVAHPQIPDEVPHTARLKEPHRFQQYYHLRNLMVRAERPIDRESTQARLKTAVCHHTSLLALPGIDNYNDPNIQDLYDVIEWAIYHHLLGFDHIFLSYVNHHVFRRLPGFEELDKLPFVTLTKNPKGKVYEAKSDDRPWGFKNGTYALGGDCKSQCVIQECLNTTATQGYDWVWVANMEEYLWYNQTVPVHEFLAHTVGSDKYNYLSFGKHKYSTHYRRQLPEASSETQSGFLAEEYPFTTETHYCERRTPSGDIPDLCPTFYGQSRVMVRPQLYVDQMDKIHVHGNAFQENKTTGQFQVTMPGGERTCHLPTDLAHMKQWATPTSRRLPFESAVLDTTNTSQLVLLSYDTEVPSLQGGLGEAAPLTLKFDKGLKEWFHFVASRGLEPNVCSSLYQTGRNVKHRMP